MIKYSKLKESIEIPCMICGNESNIVFVKNMQHASKNTFYVCDKCFRSFKADMQSGKFKEYTGEDLSRLFK